MKSELGEKNGVTCGLKSTIKHLEESLEIYKHDRLKINKWSFFEISMHQLQVLNPNSFLDAILEWYCEPMKMINLNHYIKARFHITLEDSLLSKEKLNLVSS